MSEGPTKLFATRAERYPEPTEADVIHSAARAILAAVPGVGSTITELLSVVLAPAVARRRDEWLKELAEAFDQLETKVDGLKLDNLVSDEIFVSAVIKATRAAAATHDRAKREYLRNAIVNIALKREASEEFQQIFINAIDIFTAAHVRVLNVLWTGVNRLMGKGLWSQSSNRQIQNYGQAIGALYPELNGQGDLLGYIITDLRNWGMTPLGGPSTPFPVGGNQAITNMGIRFLQFVLNPEDLPW